MKPEVTPEAGKGHLCCRVLLFPLGIAILSMHWLYHMMRDLWNAQKGRVKVFRKCKGFLTQNSFQSLPAHATAHWIYPLYIAAQEKPLAYDAEISYTAFGKCSTFC